MSLNPGACNMTGMSAFSGSGGNCDYNFKNARFYSEGESDGYKGMGFMITFTSMQPCAANPSKPMVYRFLAVCDKGGSPFDKWEVIGTQDCRRTLDYMGPEACAVYNYADLMGFAYFTALINLALGLFIAF